MIRFCMFPCSSDYIIAFAPGARGLIIVGTHSLVVAPSAEPIGPLRLGSGLPAPDLAQDLGGRGFPEFTRFFRDVWNDDTWDRELHC